MKLVRTPTGRFYAIFSLAACVVALAGPWLALNRLDPTAFRFGLALFSVSILATFSSLWTLQGPRARTLAGPAFAILKMIVMGAGLFFGVVVWRLPVPSMVVGAVSALVLGTAVFVTVVQAWHRRKI